MKLKNKLLEQLHKEALYDPVDLKKEWGEDFYECIRDIAEHPVVLRMKLYPHHGHTNCYEHCLHVAYYNYVICRYFHLDARSAARGGMAHTCTEDRGTLSWDSPSKTCLSSCKEILQLESNRRRCDPCPYVAGHYFKSSENKRGVDYHFDG